MEGGWDSNWHISTVGRDDENRNYRSGSEDGGEEKAIRENGWNLYH